MPTGVSKRLKKGGGGRCDEGRLRHRESGIRSILGIPAVKRVTVLAPLAKNVLTFVSVRETSTAGVQVIIASHFILQPLPLLPSAASHGFFSWLCHTIEVACQRPD